MAMLLAGDQRMLLCSASSSSSSSLQPATQSSQRHHLQSATAAAEAAAAEPEIKLAFHGTSNQLSIHVIEARNLRSQSAQKCNSFVRIGFSPESGGSRSAKWQTGTAPNTDFPLFDRHFAVDLPHVATATGGGDSASGRGRCLMVSVWSQLQSGGFSEFLGCVTFPLQSLVGAHKPSIWYRLVNEMTASLCAATSSSTTTSNDALNAAQAPPPSAGSASAMGGGFDLKEALIRRAPDRGLGFTVAGSCPAHVSKVERRSPADSAGVRAGDYILRVDVRRVADADNETVVRLLRSTGGAVAVRLLLGRSRSCTNGQQQLMMTSATSATLMPASATPASSAVAESPSLPLSYCQRLLDKQQQQYQQHQQQQQHHHQQQQQHHQHQQQQPVSTSAAIMKRDLRSLYDISSNQSNSIASFAALSAGYQMQFSFRDQLIVRPAEMLMHSGSMAVTDAKTAGSNPASIRVFLFPDLLLLARLNSHSQSGRDQDNPVHELVRDPIHIHQITQCFVMKGNSDLSMKYIGPDGSQHHLLLHCPAGERDTHAWCRRIQDRLLQTVIL